VGALLFDTWSGTTWGRECASRQRRLEDHLRGKCKKEDHADIVHDEVQRMGDAVIAADVDAAQRTAAAVPKAAAASCRERDG